MGFSPNPFRAFSRVDAPAALKEMRLHASGATEANYRNGIGRFRRANPRGKPAVMNGLAVVLRGAKGHSQAACHQQVTGDKEPPPKAAGCVPAQFRDSPFHQHGDSWLKERSQSKGSSAYKHG